MQSRPAGLTTGDFNRDGRLDVISTSHESNLYNVFLNKGDGKVNGALYNVCGIYDEVHAGWWMGDGLKSADFDGDGNLDLVLLRYGFYSMLRGKGDGSFENGMAVAVGSIEAQAAVGDFNGDRKPDLVFYDQEKVRVILNTTPNPNLPPSTPPRPAVSVSAASYTSGDIATGSIVTIFGTGLATETLVATTLPLPLKLGGTRVTIRDSFGMVHDAALFFVSPTQINCLLNESAALGPATLMVWSGDGNVSASNLPISQVTPGVFSADATGQGVAAATITRIKANGQRSDEAVASFNPVVNRIVPVPINLGPEGEQVYLIVYGTGWRHREDDTQVTAHIGNQQVRAAFAGAQPNFAGLDQVNILIPRSLKGSGDVDVKITFDGKTTNTVRIRVQ